MKLQHGWKILKEATRDLLETDPNDPQRSWKVAEFTYQVACRRCDLLPQEEVEAILGLVAEASAQTFCFLPHGFLEFISAHGGEAWIERFLETYPGWEFNRCPCCSQCHQVTLLHPQRVFAMNQRKAAVEQAQIRYANLTSPQPPSDYVDLFADRWREDGEKKPH